MNTIKFSKLSNITTEQHNLEFLDIFEEHIFGQKIQTYHPCNLNLFITEKCQNHCHFCINDISNNHLNFKPRVDLADEIYYLILEKTLKELSDKYFEITITGGEPTLNLSRFVNTLKLCKKYHFPCRTVSTTGINLMKSFEGKPLCQHMIENDFIHNINISRMHWDESINNSILKGKNLTNDDIERLSLFFKLNHAEMRISCNLIKGAIDSFEKLLTFVDFYRNINIDTIMFRELIGPDPILLKSIVNFNEDFKYITTLDGLYYEVKVYQYKDMLVKHYLTKPNFDKTIIASFALKNGVFLDNFSGHNFCKDLKGGCP